MRNLIEVLYLCTDMIRWTGIPAPFRLNELDKQAHKAFIAYILARIEEESGKTVNWEYLIEGSVFEFLYRSVMTDIKPEIMIMLQESAFVEIIQNVQEQLEPIFSELQPYFKQNFIRYYMDENYAAFEKKILKAAHEEATKWEFEYIWNHHSVDSRQAPGSAYYQLALKLKLEKAKSCIEKAANERMKLECVSKLYSDEGLRTFIDLCGHLRSEIRTHRAYCIPQISVLAHQYCTAVMSYIVTKMFDGQGNRLRYNFLAGLFHDLPETFTSDVPGNLKGIGKVGTTLKQHEAYIITNNILPMLPDFIRNEIIILTENEFSNKQVTPDGKAIVIEEEPAPSETEIIDGKLVRKCDYGTAFVEYELSRKYGLTNPVVEKIWRWYKTRLHTASYNGISIHDRIDCR